LLETARAGKKDVLEVDQIFSTAVTRVLGTEKALEEARKLEGKARADALVGIMQALEDQKKEKK